MKARTYLAACFLSLASISGLNGNVYGQTSIHQSPLFELATANTKSINLGKTISTDVELTPFQNGKEIYGLSISGKVTLSNYKSFARILLIDENGKEHLVYETYLLQAGSKEVSFNNFCEETKLLNGVRPVSLKILVEGAIVELTNLKYTNQTASINESFDKSFTKLHEKQINQKIVHLNEQLESKNMKWRAGRTKINQFTYQERKLVYGRGGDVPFFSGYDMFSKGTFHVGARIKKSGTAAKSTMTANFDWRKKHDAHIESSKYFDGNPDYTKGTGGLRQETGNGWMTSLKDQAYPIYCGSCWAHNVNAMIEAQINLYYNDHIDMDLSEQFVMECTDGPYTAGKGCSGGNPTTALVDMIDKGVIDEACFEYTSDDAVSCNDKCNTPTEHFYFTELFKQDPISNSEDNLKKWILEHGPLSTELWTWYHNMILIGWRSDQSGNTEWLFKDSHGYDPDYDSDGIGYKWVEFGSLSSELGLIAAIKGPFTSNLRTAADVKCQDLDNDGYYNWGIGPKPAHCVDCPDVQDCNDNDPDKGPMLESGACGSNTLGIYKARKEFMSMKSYPNPFKESTTISYDLPHTSSVEIIISDVLGKEVSKVDFENINGKQQFVWNGTNKDGSIAKSGFYICSIKVSNLNGSFVQTTKLSKL